MTAGIRYSILDLVPIRQGGSAEEALRNSLELIRCAETWGYHRYWVAEHHNFSGIASSATSVVIGYLAGATSRIRVGSGGVMLPNHAPLVIAEQFGTLATLHPGRIDLGLGRAPGTDRPTMRALRRNLESGVDTFPQDVIELQGYLGTPRYGQMVRAVPGQGTNVPLYLLGSSTFSAELAAELGLPFAFASHFAPDLLIQALEIYRKRFKPSETLPEPYVMVGVNLFAADTDESAERLATSLLQTFLNLIRGHPGELPPPKDNLDWMPHEEAHVRRMTRYSAIGQPQTVQAAIEDILGQTGADELIFTGPIFDHQARLRSFEIGAQIFRQIEPAPAIA